MHATSSQHSRSRVEGGGATPAELTAISSQPQDQLLQRWPEPAGGQRLLVTLQDLVAQCNVVTSAFPLWCSCSSYHAKRFVICTSIGLVPGASFGEFVSEGGNPKCPGVPPRALEFAGSAWSARPSAHELEHGCAFPGEDRPPSSSGSIGHCSTSPAHRIKFIRSGSVYLVNT